MNSFISHRLAFWVLLVVTVFAVVAGLLFLAVQRSQAVESQPIAFDHQAMVSLGIDCLFCHSDARRSPAAGMPSVEKCMGCHRVIATQAEPIQQLANYWQNQQPIPWKRLNRLPRFVYFTHEIHVARGLNCEGCHGDVGSMKLAQPVVEMNMGWCLDCHEKQANAAQLRDCVVCHQ